jgi:uncharacterized protein YjiS (DUF1127 family)
MSNANPASNAMSGAVLPVVPESLRRLAALAAEAVAAVVTACAMRRAYRELAMLDDRLLTDVGLDRPTVEALAARSLRETWASLAQSHWYRTHTSA